MSKKQKSTYPLFNDKVPCPTTNGISDCKLDYVKWEIKDEVVKPNYTSPTPANSFNCGKTPVCVDGNQCSNLFVYDD